MMTIKHLIAGAVVTAAVSTALVLGSAVGANAQVFPTPTPIRPPSTNQPIYNQPSYPGFHVPSSMWIKYAPVKPSSAPQPVLHDFTVLPSCSTALDPLFAEDLFNGGYALSTDSTVRATQDPQLVALITAANSINCDFVNTSTGSHIDFALVINVDDVAVAARLHVLGYTDPGPTMGYEKDFADTMRTEVQDVWSGQRGWSLASYDRGATVTDVEEDLQYTFPRLNR